MRGSDSGWLTWKSASFASEYPQSRLSLAIRLFGVEVYSSKEIFIQNNLKSDLAPVHHAQKDALAAIRRCLARTISQGVYGLHSPLAVQTAMNRSTTEAIG